MYSLGDAFPWRWCISHTAKLSPLNLASQQNTITATMGIMSKIEDKLHGDKHQSHDTTGSTPTSNIHSTPHTTGTHTGPTSTSGLATNSTTPGHHTTGTNNLTGSHGQFADTASGGHTGLGSSSHHTTSTGLPGSGPGHTHTSGAPISDSTGLGYTSGATTHNLTGRDTHGNSHVPGPYGAREDYGATGPASHTTGPHTNNAANVVDPRVHPEPEKMRNHHTVGPHQSDTLNKLDPRVDSDPRHHGYDSDPRHGGVGVGKQTGGLVGGPHSRQENHGSIPTAGGAKVGSGGTEPVGSSHVGLTGSHGGLTGSHGGLTGSHGRDPYEPHAAEHSGATGTHHIGTGSGLGHGTSGFPGGHQGGIPTERKMGGAYEAGYRDAVEHVRNEQRF